jgi:hypothetical protein
MKEETTKLKESSTAQPSQIKIQENLTNTLTKKFVDVMKVRTPRH